MVRPPTVSGSGIPCAGSRSASRRLPVKPSRRSCLGRTVVASFALCAAMLTGLVNRSSAQVPILYYDFDNNTTRTLFENAVEASINPGSGPITRAGTTSTVAGIAGAGNFRGGTSSGMAAQSDQWAADVGDPGAAATDYFQFTASTQGFADLQVTFDDMASGDGPGAVGIAYSTDGVIFGSLVAQPTGNGTFSSHVFSLPAAASNQPAITIRIYAYADGRAGRASFASSGT